MRARVRSKDDVHREVADLSRRFGPPLRQTIVIHQLSHSRGPAGFPLSSRRTAEVVLVVPRSDGRVLLHTKNFYPSGVWRLPTGGIRPGETIEQAAVRECEEETGMRLEPVRFLFALQYAWEGAAKDFQSYGFLTGVAEGRVASRDRKEQITAFRDAGRLEIAAVVERLETLAGNWAAWGRFRAAPHRVLLQLWPEDQEAIPKIAP